MLSAFGFEGQKINSTSSTNLLSCKLWITNKKFDWIYRHQYIDDNHWVLVNFSPG